MNTAPALSGLTAHDQVLHAPAAPAQLIVLLNDAQNHSVDLQPLAQALSEVFSQALILALAAPCDDAAGRHWFAPPNASGRYDCAVLQPAVDALSQRMAVWQRSHTLTAQATALVGFGQGATLALHCAQLPKPPAERIVALGGTFAAPPESLRFLGSMHLLHGKQDACTPWKVVLEDAYRLQALGADLTAEIVPMVGHELHSTLVEKTVERLSTHIAKHLFEAAQREAGQAQAN